MQSAKDSSKKVRGRLSPGFLATGLLILAAFPFTFQEFSGSTEFFLQPTPYPEIALILERAPFWFRVEGLYYRCKQGDTAQRLEDVASSARRCGGDQNVIVTGLEATGVTSAQRFAKRHQPPFMVDDKGTTHSCAFSFNCPNFFN